MSRFVRTSLFVTLAIGLFPSPSASQIFTSRDANDVPLYDFFDFSEPRLSKVPEAPKPAIDPRERARCRLKWAKNSATAPGAPPAKTYKIPGRDLL